MRPIWLELLKGLPVLAAWFALLYALAAVLP